VADDRGLPETARLESIQLAERHARTAGEGLRRMTNAPTAGGTPRRRVEGTFAVSFAALIVASLALLLGVCLSNGC
jgi:hypothetical protein